MSAVLIICVVLVLMTVVLAFVDASKAAIAVILLGIAELIQLVMR